MAMDFWGNFNAGSRFADDAINAQKQSQLARLAQQAYTASPNERQGIIAQTMGLDPSAGAQLDSTLGKLDDARTQRIVQSAKLLYSAPEAERPGLYQQLRPQLSTLGFSQLPEQYDNTVAQAAQAIATAYMPADQGGVHSTYVDNQGDRVAVLRNGDKRILGPNQTLSQIIDTGDGYYGVNKSSLNAAPVRLGGAPSAAQPNPPGVYIDPSLPPEVQAQIRQAEATGQPVPSSMTFSADGDQLRKAPEKLTPYQQAQLQQQQLANQRAEQSMDLAYRAADRADRAEARQKEANSVAGKPPAEGERNAAGFFGRMENAESILDRIAKNGYDPANPSDRMFATLSDRGGVLGGAANSKISKEGQEYRQAAMDWVRAKLRKESGAAIGKDEARQEYENYFPVYGDSKEVIQQKANARRAANEAMRQAGGRAIQAAPAQSATTDYSNLWK